MPHTRTESDFHIHTCTHVHTRAQTGACAHAHTNTRIQMAYGTHTSEDRKNSDVLLTTFSFGGGCQKEKEDLDASIDDVVLSGVSDEQKSKELKDIPKV